MTEVDPPLVCIIARIGFVWKSIVFRIASWQSSSPVLSMSLMKPLLLSLESFRFQSLEYSLHFLFFQVLFTLWGNSEIINVLPVDSVIILRSPKIPDFDLSTCKSFSCNLELCVTIIVSNDSLHIRALQYGSKLCFYHE